MACRRPVKSCYVAARVCFVIFEGFELLDLTGPFEVFQQANRLTGRYARDVLPPAIGAGPRS